jgi:hypothetical protein
VKERERGLTSILGNGFEMTRAFKEVLQLFGDPTQTELLLAVLLCILIDNTYNCSLIGQTLLIAVLAWTTILNYCLSEISSYW